MYSFAEVVPFLFEDIAKNPQFKSDLFSDEVAEDLKESFYNLCQKAHGSLQFKLEPFTTTSDPDIYFIQKEQTFEAHTFNLQVISCVHILDNACDGQVYAHYDTVVLDIDTQEQFKVSSYYDETNYDFIGLFVEQIELSEKKNSEETIFVLTEQTPENYIVLGIFKSIKETVDAFNQNEELQSDIDLLQIEEVSIGTILNWENSKNSASKISGSVRSYDLKGNLILRS